MRLNCRGATEMCCWWSGSLFFYLLFHSTVTWGKVQCWVKPVLPSPTVEGDYTLCFGCNKYSFQTTKPTETSQFKIQTLFITNGAIKESRYTQHIFSFMKTSWTWNCTMIKLSLLIIITSLVLRGQWIEWFRLYCTFSVLLFKLLCEPINTSSSADITSGQVRHVSVETTAAPI